MRVQDFMIHDVVSIHETSTIKELLETLVHHKIGGVPVINSNNQLVGMVSDGDVIRFIKPKAQHIYDFFTMYIVTDVETLEQAVAEKLEIPVNKVMTKKNLFSVSAADNMEKAISIFATHHFKKLPVIDQDRKVIGVVSRGDVIRQITKMFILREDIQ